ncbi:unnamed protein product [Cuscuta campestris]|uniref:Uncharacterized protein n=1 Tax=Cuscuta campestris TaxID=132261 RepID=A0A484MH44_9ASTE|nr:unnamed protein product [Cuscuta campestris]
MGPYHYWRPELYEMERYKLNAAKRFAKHLPKGLEFQEVVGEIKHCMPKIRASYDKYLNLNDDTLAWMLAMDACFLLEFLRVCALKGGKDVLGRVTNRMSHMVDVFGRKSAHNATLRDIVMLENQIPLCILRKMLELELSSQYLADEMLLAMLVGLYKDLSPFAYITDDYSLAKVRLQDCAHLLDFFYQVMVPSQVDVDYVSCQITRDLERKDGLGQENQTNNTLCSSNNIFTRLAKQTWKFVSNAKSGPMSIVNVIANLPWDIIGSLPLVRNLKQRFFPDAQENKKSDENNTDGTSERPPLFEEINIPTVYQLTKSGVRFLPTKSGILSITFDPATGTFHLPVVRLDVNSQVLLRNVVAYESCVTCGPLVFARYVELMNGIIDCEKDCKELREKGIVLNHLKSDGEVANLWNGMSRSIRLTKVPFLDKVIEDVNRFYNGRWKVKVGKFMKSYIYGSWKILTLLATILLLVLSGLEAFCSVYSCPRLFHIDIADSTT